MNNVPFFSNSSIAWNSNPDMLAEYRDLLGFYAGSDVARKGTNTTYAQSGFLCFKKSLEDDELLVIDNLRNSTLYYNVPPELQNTTWNNALTAEEVTLGSQLQLGPYAYLILK